MNTDGHRWGGTVPSLLALVAACGCPIGNRNTPDADAGDGPSPTGPPPDTLSATFAIRETHAVLSGATAEAMRSGTRLRNLIAHGHARVDPAKLVASAQAGLGESARFLAEVAAWEQERP